MFPIFVVVMVLCLCLLVLHDWHARRQAIREAEAIQALATRVVQVFDVLPQLRLTREEAAALRTPPPPSE